MRLAVIATLWLAAAPGWAGTTTHTDPASFQAAVSALSATKDFDLASAGTALSSGNQSEGIVWTYSLDGSTLEITDSFDRMSGSCRHRAAWVFRTKWESLQISECNLDWPHHDPQESTL